MSEVLSIWRPAGRGVGFTIVMCHFDRWGNELCRAEIERCDVNRGRLAYASRCHEVQGARTRQSHRFSPSDSLFYQFGRPLGFSIGDWESPKIHGASPVAGEQEPIPIRRPAHHDVLTAMDYG